MAQIACTVGAPKQSTILVKTSNGVETRTVTTLENSLYRCCTRSKVGGSSGYAFKIPENGYTRNDGELIDGAEPYWNIWSGMSPGQWDIKLPDRTLYLRLRRDTPSSKEYSCKKGFLQAIIRQPGNRTCFLREVPYMYRRIKYPSWLV